MLWSGLERKEERKKKKKRQSVEKDVKVQVVGSDDLYYVLCIIHNMLCILYIAHQTPNAKYHQPSTIQKSVDRCIANVS